MKNDEIIQRLKNSETKALEYVIGTYSGYVSAVLNKILGKTASREDREELLTDVFVALWRYREKMQDGGNLKYWLAVVARNSAFQYLRRLNLLQPLEENQILTDDESPEHEMERKTRAKAVREAVDNLPQEDRDIFLRHYFWQQGVAEISQETGMNINTIKSKLSRGREKLKAILIKEDVLL